MRVSHLAKSICARINCKSDIFFLPRTHICFHYIMINFQIIIACLCYGQFDPQHVKCHDAKMLLSPSSIAMSKCLCYHPWRASSHASLCFAISREGRGRDYPGLPASGQPKCRWYNVIFQFLTFQKCTIMYLQNKNCHIWYLLQNNLMGEGLGEWVETKVTVALS